MSVLSAALVTFSSTTSKLTRLKLVQPVIDSNTQSIIDNPDIVNNMAQLAGIEADLIKVLPSLQNAAVKDVAVAVKSLVDMEAASVLAQKAATAAGTPTPSTPPTTATPTA